MKLGAVLGGVVEGYNKQREADQTAQQNADAEQQRQLVVASQQDVAKNGPKVGNDVTGTARRGFPTLSSQEVLAQAGGDTTQAIPDFQSASDAVNWRNGALKNQPPPVAPSDSTATTAQTVSDNAISSQDPASNGGAPAAGLPTTAAPVAGAGPMGVGAPTRDASGAIVPTPFAPPPQAAPAGLPLQPASYAAPPPPPGDSSTVPISGVVPNAAPAAAQQRLDPVAFIKGWTFGPHAEGTAYVPHDSNGAPVRYGINAAYNPGVDLQHMSQDQAAAYLKQKYWDPSGAGNMQPALAAVHMDTTMMAGPAVANRLLQQSGGDANAYMNLRDAFTSNLVDKDPDKYGKYAHAWSNRSTALRQYVAQDGPATTQGAPAVGATAPAPNDGNQAIQGPPPIAPEAPTLDKYVPYKAANGQWRWTAEPTYATADDADQYTINSLRTHGQFEAANTLEDSLVKRQGARTANEDAQVKLEQAQLHTQISNTQDPQVMEDAFNHTASNNQFGKAVRNPTNGYITVQSWDRNTGQWLGLHTYSGAKMADGTTISPSQQMKADLLSQVDGDYGTYLQNQQKTAADISESAARSRNYIAGAASTEAGTKAGLPQAQADEARAHAGAEAAQGADAASHAASTNIQNAYDSQTKPLVAHAQAVAAGVGKNPDGTDYTPAQIDQANTYLGIVNNERPIGAPQQATINGAPTTVFNTQGGKTILTFDPATSRLLPANGPFNLPTLDKDPDWKSGAIGPQQIIGPNNQPQWVYHVNVPGAPDQGYTSFAEAKAALVAAQPPKPAGLFGQGGLFGQNKSLHDTSVYQPPHQGQ